MEQGVQCLGIDQELLDGYFGLSIIYAKQYETNPKNFISCFLKFQSVRRACSWIVWGYKKSGIFNECKGDFKDWAFKQDLEERWKPVLADVLRIIYSIIKQ